MHIKSNRTETTIDADALLNRVDGDRELLRELAELYIGDQAARVLDLREALDAADAPRLARAAHALKGAVANFCAAHAECAARQLEQLARDGNLPAASLACARLERILVRLEPELRRLASPSSSPAVVKCP